MKSTYKGVVFDISNVRDPSIYEKLSSGKKELGRRTKEIAVLCSIVIGIKEITKENKKEVFRRIQDWEETFGATIVIWENNIPNHYPLDRDDINKLVGMTIEARTIFSDQEWNEKIKSIREKIESETQKIEAQFPDLGDNPPIEKLAPGANIHIEPIIPIGQVKARFGS